MAEPLEASVTLEEIFAVVASKRVPLAPELAGYLTLEIAETPSAKDGDVDPRHVYVGEEGTVALVRPKKDGEVTGDSEASIRALLGKLLEVGGSQTPALGATAKKKAGGGIGLLVEELEAALIPVNRGAGRRALARLAREVKRVTMGVGRNAMRSSGDLAAAGPASQRSQESQPKIKVAPPPAATSFETEEQSTASHPLQKPPSLSELPTVGLTREDIEKAQGKKPQRDSVDSLLDKFEVSEKREDKALSKDLKAIAGLDPTPPPPNTMDAPEAEGIDALLGAATTGSIPDAKISDRPPTKPKGPAARRSSPKVQVAAQTPPTTRDRPSFADDRVLPTGPASLPRLGSMADIKKKKKGGYLLPAIGILIVAGLMVAILWMLKPGFFTGRTPEKIAEEQRIAAEKEEERKKALAANVTCHTAIMVSGAPDNSEILVRFGTAPVDIEHMPVGPRLEVVATMEGYAPKRAVIPQGAQWEKGSDGKPRFEIAVQLDKSKRQNEPWPAAESGTEAGGKGDPGTVHVVSTPKGSEIWLVAGQGPDSRIDDLAKCDADAEILVAGPTTYRKRMTVKAADFQADPSEKGNVRVARVTVPQK